MNAYGPTLFLALVTALFTFVGVLRIFVTVFDFFGIRPRG